MIDVLYIAMHRTAPPEMPRCKTNVEGKEGVLA